MDVLDGDDSVDLDAELLVDLHDGGFAGNLAYLAAVDGDEHIVDFHIAAAVEDRHGLAHGGAGGDDVFDDNNFIAVLRLVADEAAAFAVVFLFLAVEEVGLRDAILVIEGRGGGCGKWNTLVRRAEHGGEIFADGLLDERCVELAELCDLLAGLIVAGIDEVRRIAAALRDEGAETQHVCGHHELDKRLFAFCQHKNHPLFPSWVGIYFYQYSIDLCFRQNFLRELTLPEKGRFPLTTYRRNTYCRPL